MCKHFLTAVVTAGREPKHLPPQRAGFVYNSRYWHTTLSDLDQGKVWHVHESAVAKWWRHWQSVVVR